MGRHRCKSCLTLLGYCLLSCRVHADAHDHSEDTDTAVEQPAQTGSSEFTAWLGPESPEQHVQHLYEESGAMGTVFSWMLDASRAGCGAAVQALSVVDDHAHDPDNDHADHEEEEDGHAGHDHRRLLDAVLFGHDHAAEDEEAAAEVADSAQVILTLTALDALNDTSASVDAAVKDALAYITACRIDPTCMVEGDAAAGDADGDHDEHDHGSDAAKHIGLKIGLAATFLGMTVVTSYLPLLFMWSSSYHGILTCLNVFSGSIFLSVGALHLLPHVAEYEEAADLSTDYPVGNAFVILGFLLVLFMEQVVFDVHGANSGEREIEAKAAAKYTLVTRASSVAQRYHSPLLTEGAVVLHAVLECIVLGLAGSREDVWLLFATICSHKVFTTMSQSARFLRLGCPPGLLFLLLLPFHILPPLGVVLGAITGQENPTVSLVLAGLATGTFIYVGAFEVVAEEFADAGHAPPVADDAAAVGATPECYVSPNSDCIGAPVAEHVREHGRGAAAATKKAWIPGRALKFAVFMAGCGALLAVTAALPAHSEIHDH
eukprot:jgi/Ulvmu1/6554/UM003_0188.1